jgi:DNA-binding NarL/FixJ family response regulator
MPIRVLLADDHDILRASLRRVLGAQPDFEIVAEASDGMEAVEQAKNCTPDIALLDIGMKKMNGIEAAGRISKECPHTAILMLTVYNSELYVTRAVKAGAHGYLLKESLDDAELTNAIRTVYNGGYAISPAVVNAFAAAIRRAEGSA